MKNGPGLFPAGSAKRLDRRRAPGPFHGFTVSKSGRDSLHANDAMDRIGLPRAEMGTVAHLLLFQKIRVQFAFERRQRVES